MIEFQEESDPLLGYLREMGMIINQAQFQANQANSYLDQRPGLEMLDAGQWNCDRAYLDTSEQRRSSVYLLSEWISCEVIELIYLFFNFLIQKSGVYPRRFSFPA